MADAKKPEGDSEYFGFAEVLGEHCDGVGQPKIRGTRVEDMTSGWLLRLVLKVVRSVFVPPPLKRISYIPSFLGRTVWQSFYFSSMF